MPKDNYVTVVIKIPDDDAGKSELRQGLNMIKPYQTSMSLEDEMTILDMIENHPDFKSYIADEAREQVKGI